MQAAIWKLENDPGSDTITSGIFSISPDGITGGGATYQAFVIQTDTYLDNVNNGTWQIQPGSVVQQYTVAPGAGPNQTFAFLSSDPPAKIPEPAALAVLSTGLTALIGLSRRRRGRDFT